MFTARYELSLNAIQDGLSKIKNELSLNATQNGLSKIKQHQRI